MFGEISVKRVEGQNRIPEISNLYDVTTDGFTLTNVSVGMRLFDLVQLSASLNNVFDVIYSEPFNARSPDNPIPEPGRNLVIGLRSSI